MGRSGARRTGVARLVNTSQCVPREGRNDSRIRSGAIRRAQASVDLAGSRPAAIAGGRLAIGSWSGPWRIADTGRPWPRSAGRAAPRQRRDFCALDDRAGPRRIASYSDGSTEAPVETPARAPTPGGQDVGQTRSRVGLSAELGHVEQQLGIASPDMTREQPARDSGLGLRVERHLAQAEAHGGVEVARVVSEVV